MERNLNVRVAQKQDLCAVANVHIHCFSDSYSTQLNKFHFCRGEYGLLESFYNEYLQDNNKLFWVVEQDGEIIAFCVGYTMNKKQQVQNFQKRHRLALLFTNMVLALSFNKAFYKKIMNSFFSKKKGAWEIIDVENEKLDSCERGDLLSICVLPRFRGQSISSSLLDSFLQGMKDVGCKVCVLSVDVSNKRAIRYYEKNGFRLSKTNHVENRMFKYL